MDGFRTLESLSGLLTIFFRFKFFGRLTEKVSS